MKRQRGRSRKNNSGNNNNHGNRSFDSNGPDVKVRGSASHVHEKYITLANDAMSSGNRVKAENLRQHAEHYLRVANKQEEAKQAAREEAEAKRLAHQERQQKNAAKNASNEDGGENKETANDENDEDGKKARRTRRQPRARHEKDADTNATDEAPEGLKVVKPDGDDAPKPTRRRTAPAKPKPEAEAPTAAE